MKSLLKLPTVDLNEIEASMLISIVMPTRNAARFISSALTSALRSLGSYDAPFEILIADGGSDDATISIAERFRNVRIVSRSDSGIYDGMNIGLNTAIGQYVLILNSDDLLLPGSLVQAVRELQQTPTSAHVLGGVYMGQDLASARAIKSSRQLCAEGILFGIPAVNARLFRREALHSVGLFNTSLGLAADREWLLRVQSKLGSGKGLQFPLYFYRQHTASMTVAADRSSAIRCYHADLALADHLLESVEPESQLARLARASRALVTMKLSLRRAPYPAHCGGTPRFFDRLHGLRLAARWRGKLSGA